MTGSVTLVATPIGNLEDITLRAVRLLREADIIACEDTRRTGRLLEHLEIASAGRLTPVHEHNERQRVLGLVERVKQGANLVLVSDAGTPGICDPGFVLVRACVGAGIGVTAAPGPCAAVVAATLTGLPVHAIALRGFPPRKAGQRLRFLAADAERPDTLVYHESCHRLPALLAAAAEAFGAERPAAVVKDLTKLHERIDRSRLGELAERYADGELKGEYLLVVGGCD